MDVSEQNEPQCSKNAPKRSPFRDNIIIHTIETLEVCVHEVAIPPDIKYEPLQKLSSKPAKTYDFPLDPFQKEGIMCIENNQSVLISAHTSAGKTVVAEYSIAQALNSKQRVIYTTPIKALSNQKYREFYEMFKDVGLMTGDVTINPTASCLIMTTEILKNMLYHGNELIREVSWVVFDEIHYMRDKYRGVVWEETIILLPNNVHYVFLSATIPNARQFAEWIAWLHHQPCHVVYTEYRPTPLQHYVFVEGGDGIHLVINEKGEFLSDNFARAVLSVKNNDSAVGFSTPVGMKEESDCFKLIKMIAERNLSPSIVFSFSRKTCESNAMAIAKLDLLSKEERILLDDVFENAMEVLSEEDRSLPQVTQVLPLLRRGIGIHHGGLLPILKETIEILFSEGLIKALFATETFGMGLNMPARTVVFTEIRKFDGQNHRFISSGEYIQMSGRAGRRGIDDKGIVILTVHDETSPSVVREILKGKADPLNSAFHLTFNMVLNLLRVEGINPEFMMERSFHQFQNYSKIPSLEERLGRLQNTFKKMKFKDENALALYDNLCTLKHNYFSGVYHTEQIFPYLKSGRLVKGIEARFSNDVPEIDHSMYLGVQDHTAKNYHDEVMALKRQLNRLADWRHPSFRALFNKYLWKKNIKKEIEDVKKEMRVIRFIYQIDGLKKRKRILRRLGYYTDDIITVKGRVACEISVTDNLVVTEMLFGGVLNNMSTEEIVAVLSLFICEKDKEHQISQQFIPAISKIREIGNQVSKICIEVGLNDDELAPPLNSSLTDVVYAWCCGVPFSKLNTLSEEYEGNIIRCMRRLEELLRQMVQASRNMGNPEMESKFTKGINLLKRDIVFAASLYL